MLRRFLSRQASFRDQLLAAVTVGVLALALLASLLTAWMESRKLREELIQQGRQVTATFAEQAVLAALFAAPENAEDAARATLAFPGVRHVALYDRRGQPILQEGAPPAWTPQPGPALAGAGPRVAREGPGAVHFVAPVRSRLPEAEPASPFQPEEPTEAEPLGYVHVVVDKASLHAAQRGILVDTLAVGLVSALLLLAVLSLLLRRLTDPLQELAGIMEAARRGAGAPRAPVAGPLEVRRIAATFNAMMAALEDRDRRLRQHAGELERLVAERTRELVQARDEALRASRYKSEFLASMSHELRTPLNAILGYTEMALEALAEGPEAMPELQEDLRRVHRAAGRLLSMINSILDLAKIEAGRMELWLEPTDLGELVQEVLDTVRPLAEKNGDRLELALEQEASGQLLMDAPKLRQVLVNLLGNAVKFTQGGVVRLRVRHRPRELLLAVEDTGIGMSPEQQAHVFEPFRQADMSTTRRFGGTGLGLSIARNLVELMGGRIELRSAPGRGSTFTVRIPLPVRAAAGQGEGAAEGVA